MVTLQVKFLRTLKEKSVGLIGAKKIYPVYFRTHWGIHTLGVKFPIDILILDTYGNVVKMSQKFPPNRLFFWPPIYKNIVELPAGKIKRMQIKIGDSLTLQYVAANS